MDDTCENIVEQQVWKELFENGEVMDMMLKCIDIESSNLDFVEHVENFYSCVVLFCGMVFLITNLFWVLINCVFLAMVLSFNYHTNLI